MDHEAITVRLAQDADAATIAAIHVAAWRQAYGGLLPERMIAAQSVADRTERWQRILATFSAGTAGAAFLTFRGGRACGFVSIAGQRDATLISRGLDGEITALYVLRAEQRRGVGRALMAAGAGHLIATGHRGAALWVLKENAPARTFYDRLGGELVGAQEEVQPEAVLRDVAYGWTRLTDLVEPRPR